MKYHRTFLLCALMILSPGLLHAGPAEGPNIPAIPSPFGVSTQLFHVTQVMARTGNDNGRDDIALGSRFQGLPGSIRKAMEDLGDLLPYRSYELIDTALIRTADRGTVTMKGPGGREFRVQLRFRPGEPPEEPELVIRGFDVIDITRHPAGTAPGGDSDGSKPDGEPVPQTPRMIISTSFGMSVGETLVVGSSRLNGGDTALILLVTATR
jgi:hypothetical protein